MATLNISIPDNMRQWINSQAEGGKYTSASDYLRDLVRTDQRTKEELDNMLLKGIESGTAVEPDAAYWADKRKSLQSKTEG